MDALLSTPGSHFCLGELDHALSGQMAEPPAENFVLLSTIITPSFFTQFLERHFSIITWNYIWEMAQKCMLQTTWKRFYFDLLKFVVWTHKTVALMKIIFWYGSSVFLVTTLVTLCVLNYYDKMEVKLQVASSGDAVMSQVANILCHRRQGKLYNIASTISADVLATIRIRVSDVMVLN